MPIFLDVETFKSVLFQIWKTPIQEVWRRKEKAHGRIRC